MLKHLKGMHGYFTEYEIELKSFYWFKGLKITLRNQNYHRKLLLMVLAGGVVNYKVIQKNSDSY